MPVTIRSQAISATAYSTPSNTSSICCLARRRCKDFVHHNTLHGFQHLHFTEALAEAERLTGARGYLPEKQFREFYRAGRINRDDLEATLDETPDLAANAPLLQNQPPPLNQRDLIIAALLHPLKPVTACQLNWQLEELDALHRFQPDVEPASRERLLSAANQQDEGTAISDLWSACLEVLGLQHFIMHPEELVDLSPEQAEQMLSGLNQSSEGYGDLHMLVRKEVAKELETLLAQVGPEITLRGLLLKLTGQDLLEQIRPMLIRFIARLPRSGTGSLADSQSRAGLLRYLAHQRGSLTDRLPSRSDRVAR